MTKLRFIIGIVLILLFVSIGFFMAGNSIMLIVDILSFIVCIVAPYILISLVYSPGEQMVMLREVFAQEKPINRDILTKALSYFTSLKTLIILSGILWTLLGTVGILAHLEDANSVGSNFSVALITLIYSILYLLIVIEPLRASAEKKLVA